MIISHSMAAIPKSLGWENFIQRDLVLQTEDSVEIYYEETPTHWIVPRYYPEFIKKRYGLNVDIEYLTVDAQEIDFECYIEPRDEDQKYAIEFLAKPMQRFGILRARPGFGKTICAIKAIHLMKTKTLIVVHKEKLAQQWIDRIVEFTDIKREEIPLFAGHLNEKQLKNMKIGLAIIHTLSNRYCSRKLEYHKLMKEAGIGCVIFDECHMTIPTHKFFRGQGLLYANKYLGLSATPFRENDIKTNVIYYNLSDNVFDIGDYDLKPKAYEVYFSSNIPEKTKRWITWGNKFILQRYLKQVQKDPTYVNLVLNLIMEALKGDRNVLVLAPRKDLLQTLGKLLEQKYSVNDIGYFWSGQPEEELNHKVVFATSQIFTEGIDVPRLDTLIVLDQFADKAKLEQMIGRILRKHAHKKEPKVVFLVDREFQLQHFLSIKRRNFYNSIGFEYEIINI